MNTSVHVVPIPLSELSVLAFSKIAAFASHLHRVQQVSERHRGKVVKWLGDGVMFHFREAAPALLAALEMVEEISRSALPPARVGVHAGPAHKSLGPGAFTAVDQDPGDQA